MFNFGDPIDTANLFTEEAFSKIGPQLSSASPSKMKIQDLRNALVYARMAATAAITSGASQDVIDILIEKYDKLFEALAKRSKVFVEGIKSNRHIYLGGYSIENINKYKSLAGLLDSAN